MPTITLENGKEVEISKKSYKAFEDALNEWPQNGDTFHKLCGDGLSFSGTWGHGSGAGYAKQGNMFHTKEEAQDEAKRREMLQKMKGMTNGYKHNLGSRNYFIVYYKHSSGPVVNGSDCHKHPFRAYYRFSQDAQAAIDAFTQEEWKIYFDVD